MPKIKHVFSLILMSAALQAQADEKHHHQLEAHVHGQAQLNLALEGTVLHLELESPAANIVGFEHEPSTKAEHETIHNAVHTLENGESLFLFNKEAACSMKQAAVESELIEEEPHDDHHKDEHKHEEHHDKQAHADFAASYVFECKQADKLQQLNVGLFKAFPATNELEVQFVINNRQGAVELTPQKPVVDLR